MTVTAPTAGVSINDTWTQGVSNGVNRAPAGISGTFTSGTDTTVSASYANIAGTGMTSSFSFTKLEASTRVMVTMSGSFTAVTANVVATFGVLINGTDTTICQHAPGTALPGVAFGVQFISSLAAGTYTVQARWKRTAGSGTATRTSVNDWLTVVCEEVV